MPWLLLQLSLYQDLMLSLRLGILTFLQTHIRPFGEELAELTLCKDTNNQKNMLTSCDI